MKIIIAKTAGFCMGVRRAIEMAFLASNKSSYPIYTFGPLIHNPQVLDILKKKGVTILNQIPEKAKGTVLIRAHGVPPDNIEALKKSGLHIIDATCPRVIKVQKIIEKNARQGKTIIIIGDDSHPEVIGLFGYAKKKGVVVNSIDKLKKLEKFDSAIIVAQTTQSTLFFEEVKSWIEKNHPHYKIFNTICYSTEKRQNEVQRIAEISDSLVIVGGKNSGNTQRLAKIAQMSGKPTYVIEDASELDNNSINTTGTFGISAGASTPNWVINKVCGKLEMLHYNKTHNWKKNFYSFLRFTLLTNTYLAVGAGLFTYACAQLKGSNSCFLESLITAFYVMSMHILNNLTGMESNQYNDPNKAYFYKKNKFILYITAAIATGASLFFSYLLGILSFIIVFFMVVLGVLYNIPILPNFISKGKIKRIKDIPGSKTFLISIAWGILTTFDTEIFIQKKMFFCSILVFILSCGIVFVRTAFFALLDIQGDRIAGKETIPLLLGEKKTISLLKSILIFLFIFIFFVTVNNIFSSLGYLILLFPVSLFIIVTIYKKRLIFLDWKLEFIIESHFIIAGLFTLFWSIF